MDFKDHWEFIYTTKGVTEVSWYQTDPSASLELIEFACPSHGRVIDMGGGASVLVDRLLDAGFGHVAVLDISATALDLAKTRLGRSASQVEWIVADVTHVGDMGQFDLWHDRAVFHFLTDAEDRRKYVALATKTIPAGGHLIVGTFAPDGPGKCSGLEVCRYDAGGLETEFDSAFQLMKEVRQTHITPQGKLQNFMFALFRRR